MEMYDEQYILICASHNQATFLYSKLLKKGCKVEIIVTPSKISKACTKAIKFKASDIKVVTEEVKISNIIIRGLYKIVNNKGNIDYILIK